MEEVRHLQKKYCSQAMMMAVCVAVIFIILGEKAIAKGFLLASIFSVINFTLMARLNPLKSGRSQVRASLVAFLSILLRYLILSVPLIVSIKSVSLNFFASVVGLFAVQLVIIFNHLIINRLVLARKG
ncbi:MAG: ATP synthase subunit I [Thermodesulfobacteriota bacterium]|nr:ATP synthase subunit I [Thermodesulfobacteriota bacterium]